jgi:hypothetical protein
MFRNLNYNYLPKDLSLIGKLFLSFAAIPSTVGGLFVLVGMRNMFTPINYAFLLSALIFPIVINFLSLILIPEKRRIVRTLYVILISIILPLIITTIKYIYFPGSSDLSKWALAMTVIPFSVVASCMFNIPGWLLYLFSDYFLSKLIKY